VYLGGEEKKARGRGGGRDPNGHSIAIPTNVSTNC
jgi:hypothetical protein